MTCSLELRVSNLLQQCTFKQLQQIHAFIVTTSLHRNIHILSKFLRRSTEFGGMHYSNLIFSQMGGLSHTEITLWNAMIRGYAYNGPFDKCISMYDEMPQRGLKPNNFTYPYVLNSCSALGWNRIGKKVHCQIVKTGFERVFSVANSLFNLYITIGYSFEAIVLKNEKINDSRKVFDGMCIKPIELWNRMISEYVGIGNVECARRLFDDMSDRDVVSWNSMIAAYAKVGDVANARNLFEQMPEKNVISWTSMIGAHARSGDLEKARNFFEKMPEKNVVSWNAMISSYTQNGKFKEALDLFVKMQLEGIDLDGFTFASALSACSHLGALEFGKWTYSAEMVSLEEAHVVVKEMPFEPDIAIWGALLGGCRVRSDLKLAEGAMERAGKLKANESGVYVLLSNIYASVGQWPEALFVRENMEEKSIWKRTGCSNVIHVGDQDLLPERNQLD
ncbi:hypothetical protein F0562_031255 [Nyssa sinensis]|uniref:Pentacotripeptide-repeat region of PRORP domain-containing protein n=1 Tax=Nyssa sinensis TaxID=561372 RepID=A0A5J5ATQ7_9ASTE|nr:hypothetical protein F0562_031255 [Nyssa sinensis]